MEYKNFVTGETKLKQDLSKEDKESGLWKKVWKPVWERKKLYQSKTDSSPVAQACIEKAIQKRERRRTRNLARV